MMQCRRLMWNGSRRLVVSAGGLGPTSPSVRPVQQQFYSNKPRTSDATVFKHEDIVQHRQQQQPGTAAGFAVNEKGHRVLTDQDKQEMAALRKQDPDKYSQRTLARMFQCSRLQVALFAPAPPVKALTEALKRQAQLAASPRQIRDSRPVRKAKIESWHQKNQHVGVRKRTM